MYILSQILVCISDVFLIISMLSKNKKNIVINLILSTLLFVSHYICLAAWTGAGIGIAEIVFLLIIYFLEKNNKEKYNVYVSIATILITLIISLLTWAGWISILPMLAMTIYLIAMMFKNIIIVKTGTFLRLIFNAIYMMLLKSYFGVILSVVILIFTIVGIVRDYQTKKLDNTTN